MSLVLVVGKMALVVLNILNLVAYLRQLVVQVTGRRLQVVKHVVGVLMNLMLPWLPIDVLVVVGIVSALVVVMLVWSCWLP